MQDTTYSYKRVTKSVVDRKRWSSILRDRHPNNPTWVTLVDNMLKDEPKLMLKIARDPILTKQLEDDWMSTRTVLRKIKNSDCGSAGMSIKGKGCL